MDIDITLPNYDVWRDLITRKHSNGFSWEDIKTFNGKDVQSILDGFVENGTYPKLTVEQWNKIVEDERQKENTELELRQIEESSAPIIFDANRYENNHIDDVPGDRRSSWQLYRKYLKDDEKLSDQTIDQIECSTLRILQKMSRGEEGNQTTLIKGLVVGNVQSGKTANMAALMTMAADYGWNFFIILSGTIENLRQQTETRLYETFKKCSKNLMWQTLSKLGSNKAIDHKFQNLFDDSNTRYFNVCLKNSRRLQNLYDWINDPQKQKKVKLLIIDDEADQAGINTRSIQNNERSRINDLICSLANGKGKYFQSVNYIGYTATPYANVLNESGSDSLYPRDFIAVLPMSKEYFGPQQIFGCSTLECNYDGLDIVRTIQDNDVKLIENIHKGKNINELPQSLIDSIIWFLCCTSYMRSHKNYKKPVSMLIHTSQKISHHDNIAELVQQWFSRANLQNILDNARKIWDEERNEFTARVLKEQYSDYGIELVEDLPEFSEIQTEFKLLWNAGVSYIKMNEKQQLKYCRGIHLCVDNCANNGTTDEGEFLRLVYPDKKQDLGYAPAFIVIGGATLSRGLTIEGLISTYFLRSCKQADSLMQMGRWFGYRKGYELLPRLWITKRTNSQFEFLSLLDQELREEIARMMSQGISPSEYGPKVKASPAASFINITSKNKMQSAELATLDCTGNSKQTYLFDNNEAVIRENIDITETFLKQLGRSRDDLLDSAVSRRVALWDNVKFELIKDFLLKFNFQRRLCVFGDINPLIEWIEQCIRNKSCFEYWDVVVAGKKVETSDYASLWKLPDGKIIRKVTRTRKRRVGCDSLIDIGALWNPKDLYVDYTLLKNPVLKDNNPTNCLTQRANDGFEKIPMLLIYRIDKNSKATEEQKETREDLNVPDDLIGVCIHIPGTKEKAAYETKIRVKLDHDFDIYGCDIEDGELIYGN